MISKKLIPALLISTVLAASVSSSAMAHDRDGLAIAAGILGAVAVGSIIANTAPVYAAPQPVYQPVYQQVPQPVYYQAPQQVYYQPAQVYAAPTAVYVAPQYRHYHHRDYDRRYYDERY